MDEITGLDVLDKDTGICVAIGCFDGVHLGHQKIIKEGKDIAERNGQKFAVLTFEPHPEEVLAPDPSKRLTDRTLKREFIEKLSPDYLVVMPFDMGVSKLTPRQFVDGMKNDCNLKNVVVGQNFLFGAKAGGNTGTLTELGHEYDFGVHAVALLEIGGKPVSSTRIRGLLSKGDIERSKELLGRYPLVRGTVKHGAGRGEKLLGYPTANLEVFNEGSIPGDGVYGGLAVWGGKTYKAGINVGRQPTFNGGEKVVEAFLISFDGDLYGETIDLQFHKFIRRQEKFTFDELSKQIKKDVAWVTSNINNG